MWGHSKKNQRSKKRVRVTHKAKRQRTVNVRPPGTMARNLMSKNRCRDSHRCLCSAGVGVAPKTHEGRNRKQEKMLQSIVSTIRYPLLSLIDCEVVEICLEQQ